MVTLPFPPPGRLVEGAYRSLEEQENGTPDQKRALALSGSLERPWDPPSCPPALRGQVWQWLDEVAAWINHEYTWGVERLIPPCWPAHPHIAHELAVVADLRRTAGRDTTSALLDYWHRDVLPMFLERVHLRLASGCAVPHQDWTAAARYRAFTNDSNQARRRAWFTADCKSPYASPAIDHDARSGAASVGSGGQFVPYESNDTDGEQLVVDPETGLVIDLNDRRQRPS